MRVKLEITEEGGILYGELIFVGSGLLESSIYLKPYQKERALKRAASKLLNKIVTGSLTPTAYNYKLEYKDRVILHCAMVARDFKTTESQIKSLKKFLDKLRGI